MKLRLRSQSTNETLKVTIPSPSSLLHLQTLIASSISPSPSPSSLHLSLNRRDPLPSVSALSSGDLLFFSITDSSSPTQQPITPQSLHTQQPITAKSVHTQQPIMAQSVDTQEPIMVDSQETIMVETAPNQQAIMDESVETQEPIMVDSAQNQESIMVESAMEGELMDVCGELPVKKPATFVGFLQKVLEAEDWEGKGDIGRLIVAVHAVFLDSGFVVSGGDGLRLPDGWATKIPYTVPGLMDRGDAKIGVLKFSVMRRYVTVYGSVVGGEGPGCGVCLDVSQMVGEKEVFELWKVVRDGLALPLMIDICEVNGLPLPPCFARLPTELKARVMELLPGADIARAGCTGRELRYLSGEDGLWKRKFEEEFGLLDGSKVEGRNWKDKFAKSVLKRKDEDRRRRELFIRARPRRFVPGPQPFPVPLPGIVGGDHDMFPFGGHGPLGPRIGFPHLPGSGMGFPHLPGTGTGLGIPGRRNFSPHCNLGEDSSFM